MNNNSWNSIRKVEYQLEKAFNKMKNTKNTKPGHYETYDEQTSLENSGDFLLENGRLVKKHGIHWVIAAFFIVADMAGSGIVALPTAIVRCRFEVGIFLLLLMAALATCSSIMLGKAWVIMVKQFPVYRTHCRNPYAEMGYRALGPKMKLMVSICLNVTQFGASTVFLLLIAKNSDDLMRTMGIDLGLCLMIVVITLVLLPITMFKSPQDFWPVVVLGMVSTGIAVILVCIGASLDYECFNKSPMPSFKPLNVLIALGTIMFTFGGHSALPTIQHDMQKPFDFSKASILAFSLITIMNLSAVFFGGLMYGGSLRASVINSIQTYWIQQTINVLISAHCLLTFTLIINPLNQEAEEIMGVPQCFSVRRVIIRVVMMASAGFMAASIPTFETILSLIGGLAFTSISMIFPCLFYLYLAASEKSLKKSAQNATSNVEYEYSTLSFIEPEVLLLCGIICVVGSVSGAIATITSIGSILSSTTLMETKPCYIQLFTHTAINSIVNYNDTLAVTNCCGEYQNISLSHSSCTRPDLNFLDGKIFR